MRRSSSELDGPNGARYSAVRSACRAEVSGLPNTTVIRSGDRHVAANSPAQRVRARPGLPPPPEPRAAARRATSRLLKFTLSGAGPLYSGYSLSSARRPCMPAVC